MAWLNEYRAWLSESQSLKNAQEVVNFLYTDKKDWSKESISALIGNMRHESSINPNMYEFGYDWSSDRGFGLVQWTPRSKYWNWGSAKGYTESQLRSGDAQLDRIDYEVDNNIQWIAKASNFNGLTFKEFRTNSKKLSVGDLTEAFTWGYERPNAQAGAESMPARKAFANKAFNDLKWSGGGGNPDPNPDPDPDPDPDPEPPPDPIIDIDFSTIDKFYDNFVEGIVKEFTKIINELMEQVEKMLTVDLYKYGNSQITGNHFLKIMNQLENMYKIKPTLNFFEILDKIIKDGEKAINDSVKSGKDLLGDVIDAIEPDVSYPDPDPDPDPDPGPNPNDDMYFPVNKNNAGINFWVKENYSSGSTQYDMGYGTRSNGKFHAGYDIGSGGNAGYKVYAIRDCTITDIRQVSGGGYSVFMKHDTDKYHSMFLHLVEGSAVVNKGDKVKAGEQIAVMGNTGGNYAIHLHVEISETGEFHTEANTINPQKYLKVTGDNKTSLPNPK